MSEPITLYRDGDELTVYAPSWAKQLQAEGWTLEPAESDDEVPFDFAPAKDESEPAPKPRRGRKPKAKA